MTPSGSKELTREELYEKVWAAPTVQVASELGISDVALAKRCKKLNVPKPSLGYWAKVAAGQKPERVPLPPTAAEAFVQAAQKPVPKVLSLLETTEELHPLATDLLRQLGAAKPSHDKRVSSGEWLHPQAQVSKGLIETAAKCFHVIITNVESVGIPYRKGQGYNNPGYFRKGNDRLYLGIEEELVESVETARRRSWQAPEDRRVPSGRLTFSLYHERYSNRDAKQWKEDAKTSLDALLSKIVAEIRRYFVAAQKRREQEAIEREKQRIESEHRWREYQAKEAIRLQEERKQKHAAALAGVAHTRSEDLIKAAEWWRLHRVTMKFINECEQRWRGNPAGVTAEQEAWLAWARENANAMSPLETGYPDAAKDGPFDPAAVPFGGPYPAKRHFPRPPTMPKIPPPIAQQSGYSHDHVPQPKQQYPFWLKYQGR